MWEIVTVIQLNPSDHNQTTSVKWENNLYIHYQDIWVAFVQSLGYHIEPCKLAN